MPPCQKAACSASNLPKSTGTACGHEVLLDQFRMLAHRRVEIGEDHALRGHRRIERRQRSWRRPAARRRPRSDPSAICASAFSTPASCSAVSGSTLVSPIRRTG